MFSLHDYVAKIFTCHPNVALQIAQATTSEKQDAAGEPLRAYLSKRISGTRSVLRRKISLNSVSNVSF